MKRTVILFNRLRRPCFLEATDDEGTLHKVPFERLPYERIPHEFCWQAQIELPTSDKAWWFQITTADGTHIAPYGRGSYDNYYTTLTELWIQHGQIFAYEPKPILSESRVVKIPHFFGSLPKRSLYIYLPRGYDQHQDKAYPVIYMHDGQNCFEQYVQESFSGSWKAEQAADQLIANGQMRECLIVAVGNGGSERIAEYLPDYAVYRPNPSDSGRPLKPIKGRASLTAEFYMNEVTQFVEQYYRALPNREDRATIGSSMGGLFSTYLGWEHAAFAKNHAALSSSYWITGDEGKFAIIERLQNEPPRDIRLWVDSGTQDGGGGDDGLAEAILARDALIGNGYQLGENLAYYVHQDAGHHESAWAERLPLVFQFLLPF